MEHNNTYRVLILHGSIAGLVLSVSTCIEPFQTDVPRRSNNYLVDAVLLDDPRYQYARIYYLSDHSLQEPVYTAVINFEDDSGMVYFLELNEEGHFSPPHPISIQTGQRYRFRAFVSDSVTLVSGWETVPEKVNISSVSWEQAKRIYFNHNGIPIERNGLNFLVSTEALPDDKTHLRWEYETTHINEAPYAQEKYCYVKTTPESYTNSLFVADAAGKTVDLYLIDFIELDKKFSYRLSLIVRQISQSETAGVFYTSLHRQKQIRGSIFDPPPAVLTGNIFLEDDSLNYVYGLFEIGRLDEVPVHVFRSDIPNDLVTYVSECIAKFYSGQQAPECYSCGYGQDVTSRPYYFD